MIVLFFLMVGSMGWLFGQYTGSPAITPYILVGALVYVIISYYSGAKLALAMNGAKQIEKRDNPRLWRTVENLAITEGLPMPKVYMIDDPAPNAFATGRNPANASVAVTTGLMDILDNQELQGVMAHELGHIKNYDMRVALVAFALVAIVSILADIMWRISWFGDGDDNNSSPLIMIFGIVAIILAPLIAALIQMAISRKREFLADATGALTTRYPDGLARALEKIGKHGSAMHRQNPSTAHFFFASPLKGKGLAKLFSTHPPIEERVQRLRAMGDQA